MPEVLVDANASPTLPVTNEYPAVSVASPPMPLSSYAVDPDDRAESNVCQITNPLLSCCAFLLTN